MRHSSSLLATRIFVFPLFFIIRSTAARPAVVFCIARNYVRSLVFSADPMLFFQLASSASCTRMANDDGGGGDSKAQLLLVIAH